MKDEPEKCERCSGQNIVRACVQCGAPICCIDCCNDYTAMIKALLLAQEEGR